MASLVSLASAAAAPLLELEIGRAPVEASAAPIEVLGRDFTVPRGPGTLEMTFTEEAHVAAPGGFTLQPADRSNDRIGRGGGCRYDPQDPVVGRAFTVRCVWSRDFSKKTWTGTLTGRWDRATQRRIGSAMRLKIEFVPAEPGAAPVPAISPPSAPPATASSPRQPAPGLDPAASVPPSSPPSSAATAPSPPPAPTNAAAPPPPSVVVAPPGSGPAPSPPVAPVPATTGLPRGVDQYDSVSAITGDPFDGGGWSNARNRSARATRTLRTPACIVGLQLPSAGTDVDTTASSIIVTLVSPEGARRKVLHVEGAAIDRTFSGGGRATIIVPAQTRRFVAFRTARVEVAMTGHGWFQMNGLRFAVVPCP
ncbi:MAG: hypothetical protein OEL76_07555 [Siculibacillus sp.]|nr:hypothetical protein [Siculibacillus sp.]